MSGGVQAAAPGLPWPARRRLAQALMVLPASLGAGRARAAAAGGVAPERVAREPRPIFVLNSQDATVSVIDPVLHTERTRLPVGREPHHLYLTPDERHLIVANAQGNSLTFIDPVTAEVQRTLHHILDPYHLRFSPDMKWLVTAANRLHHLDIYRWLPGEAVPLQLARRLPAHRTPSHLAIDRRSTVVYASMQDSDELLAVDLHAHQPRWKVKVGRMPADVFLLPDDRTLLVALTGDVAVEAWDVSGAAPRLRQRIVTGAGAHAFRARGDGRHVFVSNRVANTISQIDLQTLAVTAVLPAPGGPDCIEVMDDRRTLLVTSRWARRLTWIDAETRQVIRQVAVGRSPHGVWTLNHAPR